MGVNLFMHSVRLVLGDWQNALRITGVLYLIYAIPALVLGLMFPEVSTEAPTAEALGAAMSFAPIGIITALLLAVVYIWLAVTWHRYILLDEVPSGQLPPFDQSRILSYAGAAILLALILFAVSIVVSLVLSPLLFAGPFLIWIVPIVVLFVALIIDYRLGLVLPARAIGKPLTFGEAWQASRGQNATILVLAIISAIAAVLIDLPAVVLGAIPAIGGILAMLWTLATGWVKVMVGVSILTTLYGYYVEKRDIPA